MRRTIAGAGALALIWAAAASAVGGAQTYEGELADDPKAVVELEVETGARRVVTEFTVRKFPLECEGGTAARLQRARLAGRGRVSEKGRFTLKASNASQELGVRGRLGRGGAATGTVEYEGLTEFADATRECSTERLRWVASRADPRPENASPPRPPGGAPARRSAG